jgi:uncharacterized membrane protein YcaP (DUF421 family)
MDPGRIVVRILVVWIFVLALVRVSGKRTVKQGDLASFVVALILGDMFDDAIWAEVPMAEFFVGAGTLVLLHLLVSIESMWRGERRFRARAGGGGAA